MGPKRQESYPSLTRANFGIPVTIGKISYLLPAQYLISFKKKSSILARKETLFVIFKPQIYGHLLVYFQNQEKNVDTAKIWA